MDTFTQISRGVLGVAVLLILAFLLSGNRRKVNWYVVFSGVALQVIMAFLVLRVTFVKTTFEYISKFFVALLDFTMKGAEFVFGYTLTDDSKFGFVFAFQVLPTVIFFSALTSLLYYLGILQKIVYVFAWVMSKIMRLSGAESLAAAANVFVGQTEAPLVVKPYISKMTRSEIMALMTGGMATIAGAVLIAYIGMLGGDNDVERQKFATFLLCASIMNAPAALYIAKIIVPETKEVDQNLNIPKEKVGSNVLDAISSGTTQGMQLAINVAAMLIVFVAIMAMFNFVFSDLIGAFKWSENSTSLNEYISSATDGQYQKFTLELIFGYIFAPLAWVVGINGSDVTVVGQLLGVKMILNEFFAYGSLSELIKAGVLSEQSVFIATFALCGFANFSSIGIQLGGIGVLAPNQRENLASLGIKAMLGGTIASLLTATIAGIFYSAV